MTQQPVPGQPLPIPPNFPVRFGPEEAQLLWTTDLMHFPRPVTPLTADFSVEKSFNEVFRSSGVPLVVRCRRINTYYYSSFTPTARSPEEAAEAGKETEQKMGAVMAELQDFWDKEILPQVMEHIDFFEHLDLKNSSLQAMLTHVNEASSRHRQLWTLHFRTVTPAMLAVSLFDEFYRDLFGSSSVFDAYRLIQGFDNLTLKTARELWFLGRRAAAVPEVRSVLETEAVRDVIPALERTEQGQAFLEDLRAYLTQYGQRGGEFFELADPSLVEDPAPVIRSLKDFVGQPDRDMDAELATLAAERERLLAESRHHLEAYPEAVRGQFEFLLRAAQAGVVITEDHNFYIDYKSTYQIRRVLLEAGRRLVEAGALAAVADVFMLTLDELRASLSTPGSGRRALVAERRAEMAHYAGVAPPPMLGTLPPGEPPSDPMSRTTLKFFGGPPQVSDEPGVLKGNAGSPGKVTARARVMHSLSGADQLQRGEVLVTETTAPPWTPLFDLAAAVVTDTGGILSHCAVVAREYGIPAVVGVALATATIHDGQLLEVDGDAGTVRLLE